MVFMNTFATRICGHELLYLGNQILRLLWVINEQLLSFPVANPFFIIYYCVFLI